MKLAVFVFAVKIAKYTLFSVTVSAETVKGRDYHLRFVIK